MLQLALDPEGPLNRRVCAALRKAILERRIAPGSKLPSSRALAADLGVSRNTVLYAYEQLAAEGYVETRVGSGTYVVDSLAGGGPGAGRGEGPGARRRNLSSLGVRLAREESSGRGFGDRRREGLRYEFRFAGAGHERETLNTWARLVGRRARSLSRAPTGYQPPGGSSELREALAGYLGARSRSRVPARADRRHPGFPAGDRPLPPPARRRRRPRGRRGAALRRVRELPARVRRIRPPRAGRRGGLAGGTT